VADGAIFCNEYDRRFAVDRLGVDASRAFFVRAGVADHFLGLPSPSHTDAAEIKIAVIGPFMWRKGALTAASALSRILKQWPQVRASWLGADQSDVFGALDPSVVERVTVRPRYENSELPAILSDHQFLLVLSRAEGFPGVVLEGLACGLAVIASDIPGPRDILAGTRAGVLVPPGDPERVAKEVEFLLQDRKRLLVLRQEAHRIAQGYGWRDVAAENMAIYRELIDRKRLSP
jgi:glycosyltransferase involved in cell wall biosynthesis